METIIEKVTVTLKKIKQLEAEVKDLKKSNANDRDAIIEYMMDNKKRFLGGLELKLYKGNYYLSVIEDLF